ncbi:hypothetical protein [Nocardia wallacei]|uniref:hypothetical protein n=1 Tax=Nocardia wallacei TaxID=480035 RepID=UPI002457598E|nr:hypothetical protein [Nocardia wallacei]
MNDARALHRRRDDSPGAGPGPRPADGAVRPGSGPPSQDRSDVEQAREFSRLLTAEAESLTTALRAIARTRRGTPRSTAESHRLRRDLREVQRCLDNLRDRFPEIADDHPAIR